MACHFCVCVIDTLTNHLSLLTITYHLSFSFVCPSSLLLHPFRSILPIFCLIRRLYTNLLISKYAILSLIDAHFSSSTNPLLTMAPGKDTQIKKWPAQKMVEQQSLSEISMSCT